MKRFNKVLSTLLVLAMIVPGVVGATPAPAVSGPQVIRLAGASRVETAVAASQEVYRSGANAVVLAGYSGEVDALAGTLLASSKNAPLLLTTPRQLSPATETELSRLSPTTIYILGGTNAVSQAVENKLKENYTVERIGGANRYATAANIGKKAKGRNGAPHVFLTLGRPVVEGDALSDALSIGPVSALRAMPVLLTEKGKLPQDTKDALVYLGVTHVTIVGGESAVTTAVTDELSAYSVTRVRGENRYETALAVAEKYFNSPKNVVLAYARKSADGLVGGYLGSKVGGPILLTDTADLNAKTDSYVRRHAEKAYVLGGINVISPSVVTKLEEAIDEGVAPVDLAREAFNIEAAKVKTLTNSNNQVVADINYIPYGASIRLYEEEYKSIAGTNIFQIMANLGVKQVKVGSGGWIDVNPGNAEAIMDAGEIVAGENAFSVNYTAKIQPPGHSEFTQFFTINFTVD